jgi:hypothetical protein
MNVKERNSIIAKIFIDECLPILDKKGADYSAGGAWAQMEDLEKSAGIRPEQALFTFMHKHWMTIALYVSGAELQGEAIDEKLKDLTNYALIFLTYLREKRKYAELNAVPTDFDRFRNL